MLTGCLSDRAANKVYVPAPAVERYKPERPETLILEDEKFLVCPKEEPRDYVCMTPDGARAVVRNKTKVIRWVKEAGSLIDFYESDP